jgi:hypothetical protein
MAGQAKNLHRGSPLIRVSATRASENPSFYSTRLKPVGSRTASSNVFESPSTLVMTTVSIDAISRKCRSVAHDRAHWATHSSWIMIEPEAKWDLNGALILIPFVLPLFPSPISALSGYDERDLRFCAKNCSP